MGTKKHAPKHDPPAPTGHAHDDANPPQAGGIRPGTKSRILEARERAKEREK